MVTKAEATDSWRGRFMENGDGLQSMIGKLSILTERMDDQISQLQDGLKDGSTVWENNDTINRLCTITLLSLYVLEELGPVKLAFEATWADVDDCRLLSEYSPVKKTR
jgi:hypothetical protein